MDFVEVFFCVFFFPEEVLKDFVLYMFLFLFLCFVFSVFFVFVFLFVSLLGGKIIFHKQTSSFASRHVWANQGTTFWMWFIV